MFDVLGADAWTLHRENENEKEIQVQNHTNTEALAIVWHTQTKSERVFGFRESCCSREAAEPPEWWRETIELSRK